ncbi:unnamed protein product [Allacma fusca]|uniref:Solute carrier organic anion transporter family member n=1 Tax=Allacma fusca TaxID=39272 RepID=A0A8J2K9P3_9HEXA|nr:unnamed protein product [Allacma fusca]
MNRPSEPNDDQVEVEEELELQELARLKPATSKENSVVYAAKDEEEEEEEKSKYGWSTFQPECLQFMSNRKAFLFVFSMTCILQGTFHTYFVAVITTLEKLFSIPSKTTGMLMSATEIGQVCSSLLLPYYVSTRHRPHWISYGSILLSIATLLTVTPHLLYPPKIPKSISVGDNLCVADEFGNHFDAGNSTEQCFDERDPPPYFLFGILFVCLLCVGLGQTAVYTLGIPYLDDNVASRDSPLYFSITIGVRILGPVFGFILGSFCTRLFIYPGEEPEGMTPLNPRWLGAWWLGMLFISSLLFITSVLIYGFPQTLNKKRHKENIAELAAMDDATGPKLSNFPMTLKRLFVNRILMLRTCSSVLHLLPISGLYTFLPKYLESQFRLAAFEANIYTGIAGILVMGIGIFSSGVYIRTREPDAKTVALWVACSAIIYAAGMAALMFAGCDQQDIIVDDFRSPSCETEHCTNCADIYSPVCADNKTFLSICHAGCHTYNNQTKEYECDCTSTPPTPGLCPSTCNLFHLYSFIFIVIVLVHSSSEVGSMLLTLRCVRPADKAMALGLVQCAIGLLGNVPCPIIYGSIVDSTCKMWVTSRSGCHQSTGHCWLYDSNKFRVYFHGTTSFFMFLASLFDISIYFKAQDIQINASS